MSKINKKQMLFIGGAAAVIILILLVIAFMGKKTQNEMPKIGFVMSGSMDEEGWNGKHYMGIKNACEKLGIEELLVKENVKEFTGECKEAIRE